jgi:hypothetical protein
MDTKSHPFAGNGLIVGTNDEGESIDPVLTTEFVKKHVLFMDIATLGLYLALQKAQERG